MLSVGLRCLFMKLSRPLERHGAGCAHPKPKGITPIDELSESRVPPPPTQGRPYPKPTLALAQSHSLEKSIEVNLGIRPWARLVTEASPRSHPLKLSKANKLSLFLNCSPRVR